MIKNRFEDLRRKAQDQLETQVNKINDLERPDLENLVHELAVHQIELELQNEELQRSRIEVEEARDRYQDLYEFAPIGYFGLDEHNRILDVNITGCILLKSSRSNILNKLFTKFISPQESESFYLFRKKLLAVGTQFTYELQMQTENGVPFFAQIESLNVGQEKLRLAVIDITARRKVEEILAVQKVELEAACKDMEGFSATISHDLRTPLRTICSFSEILLVDYADKLDDTGKELLNRIVQSSQIMSQLTVDILKLIYFSQAEILRENVDLSVMIKTIADDLMSTQPERQVDFIIAPNLIVKGDKNLLEIGLRNILENAWKFSSKCSKTRIEFGMIYQNSVKVYYIRDNGVGFDMKYIDKLFEPFQRLHTNDDFPGHGIGLATVQRVIRRHGGKIWAESGVGKLTTFYFTLDDHGVKQ